MTLLGYNGHAPGTRKWPGPVTRTMYPFGLDRPEGYVDARDAAVWLEHIASPFEEVDE